MRQISSDIPGLLHIPQWSDVDFNQRYMIIRDAWDDLWLNCAVCSVWQECCRLVLVKRHDDSNHGLLWCPWVSLVAGCIVATRFEAQYYPIRGNWRPLPGWQCGYWQSCQRTGQWGHGWCCLWHFGGSKDPTCSVLDPAKLKLHHRSSQSLSSRSSSRDVMMSSLTATKTPLPCQFIHESLSIVSVKFHGCSHTWVQPGFCSQYM